MIDKILGYDGTDKTCSHREIPGGCNSNFCKKFSKMIKLFNPELLKQT